MLTIWPAVSQAEKEELPHMLEGDPGPERQHEIGDNDVRRLADQRADDECPIALIDDRDRNRDDEAREFLRNGEHELLPEDQIALQHNAPRICKAAHQHANAKSEHDTRQPRLIEQGGRRIGKDRKQDADRQPACGIQRPGGTEMGFIRCIMADQRLGKGKLGNGRDDHQYRHAEGDDAEISRR